MFSRSGSFTGRDGVPSRGRRAVHACRAAFAVALVTWTTACYDLRPTMQIEPRQDVEFRLELTDAARVAVVDKLGPEVKEVTGRVVRRDGDDVTLAVAEVIYLRGDQHRMGGEEVHFNRQQLSSVTERQFSLTKSLLLAAGVAVAVGLFVGSRSLFGSGQSSGDGNCSGPGCGSTSSLHP